MNSSSSHLTLNAKSSDLAIGDSEPNEGVVAHNRKMPVALASLLQDAAFIDGVPAHHKLDFKYKRYRSHTDPVAPLSRWWNNESGVDLVARLDRMCSQFDEHLNFDTIAVFRPEIHAGLVNLFFGVQQLVTTTYHHNLSVRGDLERISGSICRMLPAAVRLHNGITGPLDLVSGSLPPSPYQATTGILPAPVGSTSRRQSNDGEMHGDRPSNALNPRKVSRHMRSRDSEDEQICLPTKTSTHTSIPETIAKANSLPNADVRSSGEKEPSEIIAASHKNTTRTSDSKLANSRQTSVNTGKLSRNASESSDEEEEETTATEHEEEDDSTKRVDTVREDKKQPPVAQSKDFLNSFSKYYSTTRNAETLFT